MWNVVENRLKNTTKQYISPEYPKFYSDEFILIWGGSRVIWGANPFTGCVARQRKKDFSYTPREFVSSGPFFFVSLYLVTQARSLYMTFSFIKRFSFLYCSMFLVILYPLGVCFQNPCGVGHLTLSILHLMKMLSGNSFETLNLERKPAFLKSWKCFVRVDGLPSGWDINMSSNFFNFSIFLTLSS